MTTLKILAVLFVAAFYALPIIAAPMLNRTKMRWAKCAWHQLWNPTGLWYAEDGTTLPFRPWHIDEKDANHGICPACQARMKAETAEVLAKQGLLDHDCFNATQKGREIKTKLAKRFQQ